MRIACRYLIKYRVARIPEVIAKIGNVCNYVTINNIMAVYNSDMYTKWIRKGQGVLYYIYCDRLTYWKQLLVQRLFTVSGAWFFSITYVINFAFK